MVQSVLIAEWSKIHAYLLAFEEESLITRTFRRLDPHRQEAVILAILTEAVENGPTTVNIKQVAQRAGVAVGTLYTYFHNREGMLDFVIELVSRFMLDEMASYRLILTALPIREGLQAYISGGIEWSQLFAGVVQLYARAAYQGDPDLQERLVRPVAQLLLEIVRDMLVQAMARGEVRTDIDLEATSRALHAFTIVVGDSQLLPYLNTYFQVHGGDVELECTLVAMIDVVMAGIGANESGK
jgi:AcrR family transcriptional regulator